MQKYGQDVNTQRLKYKEKFILVSARFFLILKITQSKLSWPPKVKGYKISKKYVTKKWTTIVQGLQNVKKINVKKGTTIGQGLQNIKKVCNR